MPPTKLKEHRNAEVCALYLEGLTQKEIAERFGVSQPRISKILNDSEIEMRPRETKYFCVNGHELKDSNLIYSTFKRNGKTYKGRKCKICAYAKTQRFKTLQRKKASLLDELIAESSKGHLLCKDCEPMLEEWLSKKLSGK